MGALVKDLCDRFKVFLARCVPDLQLKDLLLELDDEGAKLDANCHLVVNFELIGRNTMHQTALAHARVPYNYHLEQRVVLGLLQGALVANDFVWHFEELLHQLGRFGRRAILRDRCS